MLIEAIIRRTTTGLAAMKMVSPVSPIKHAVHTAGHSNLNELKDLCLKFIGYCVDALVLRWRPSEVVACTSGDEEGLY